MIEKFCKEQQKHFLDIGGIILFDKQTSIEFCEYLFQKNCLILGIDGFFVFPNNKIQPSMENSIDISCNPYKVEFIKDNQPLVLDFIRQQPSNMFFEIIYDTVLVQE
jgi:hypothetical protein